MKPDIAFYPGQDQQGRLSYCGSGQDRFLCFAIHHTAPGQALFLAMDKDQYKKCQAPTSKGA